MENMAKIGCIFFMLISFSIPLNSEKTDRDFLRCFSSHIASSSNISDLFITTKSLSYSSLLLSNIFNLRFTSPRTKPLFIVSPTDESHVQAAVLCCKLLGISIRTRSGGHDYEGLSYQSYDHRPFAMIDMRSLRSVSVDVRARTAWVQAGVTLGELYYRVGEKSNTLAFPAGMCPGVGVGGHISGGGMGVLVRKYGLAADHVLDAKLVDSNGTLLDRNSMGEDYFWAIRGGGGASFAIIVSWKLRLVVVPPTVTFFSVQRKEEDGALDLVYKWQHVAPKVDDNLFLEAVLQPAGGPRSSTKGAVAVFNSLFLGRCSELLQLMTKSFPELGLNRSNCLEITWIQSILSFAPYVRQNIEGLVNKDLQPKMFLKAKTDFVKEPIPRDALEGIWKKFAEPGTRLMVMDPYGGVMDNIEEGEIPFPHRKGNLYNIQYLVAGNQSGFQEAETNIAWIRSIYKQMTPYVSKNPRSSYINFRDLDLGRHEGSSTSYSKSKRWGTKYFKSNFKRLAIVKGEVDPENFFRDEQSIPPLLVE